MSLDLLTLALSAGELPARLGQIFYFVVLPMLLLAAIGFVIQKKLGLDMPTLTRMNFYFVTPGMVYFSVVSSRVTIDQIAQVVGFSVATMAVVGAITLAVARLRGVPRDQHNTMLMTTILNNSGNYGLPLQDLAFRSYQLGPLATSYAVFVMLVQNVAHFTIGILLAAGGKKDRHWKENLLFVAKFPPLYALAAALLTVQIRIALGNHAPAVAAALQPFWEVISHLRLAYVPVALGSLGAQLALIPHSDEKYPVKASLVLRLLVAPAVGLGLCYLMGIHGFLAQLLIISTATPSSVNSALLCLQFNNHPAYAARTVFYSTLLSSITVTIVIFLVQGDFLDQLAFSTP
ncbi:MAG: AEC family transporter [Phycisphaerae bacterium]|jgi:hypothetical protein